MTLYGSSFSILLMSLIKSEFLCELLILLYFHKRLFKAPLQSHPTSILTPCPAFLKTNSKVAKITYNSVNSALKGLELEPVVLHVPVKRT